MIELLERDSSDPPRNGRVQQQLQRKERRERAGNNAERKSKNYRGGPEKREPEPVASSKPRIAAARTPEGEGTHRDDARRDRAAHVAEVQQRAGCDECSEPTREEGWLGIDVHDGWLS